MGGIERVAYRRDEEEGFELDFLMAPWAMVLVWWVERSWREGVRWYSGRNFVGGGSLKFRV